MSSVIECSALSKRFGRKMALDDLDLEIPAGSVHAVVGSNGAGKSTLFRLLLGVLSPSAGECRVLGVPSSRLDAETRGRIGLVTEEHSLPAWSRVSALLAMNRDLYKKWDETTYRRVVGHFNIDPGQKVSQLSRGERAGLNLAMAMAQRPELLILDEPTLGIDVVAKQAFLEALLFAGETEESTVIYCSHQLDEIERVADQLIILEQGRLSNHSRLDEFCSRVSAWLVEGLPQAPGSSTIPGLLQTRPIDEALELVVIDADPELTERLKGFGASSIHRLPIGLDRSVNAYLTRNHITPYESEHLQCGTC